MQNKAKQLYHCDRCGEVFRSKVRPLDELTCTQCGMPPARSGFTQLAQIPTLDHSDLDSSHGVAGRDEADFFSMQKRKKQKRAVYVYISWFVLLFATLGIGYYIKHYHDNREEERDTISQVSRDYEARKAKALRASKVCFRKFSKSANENQRAIYIYDGKEYLVDIRNYYKNRLGKEPYKNKKLIVIESELVEKEGFPRQLNVLFRIAGANVFTQYFEAVFWQKDGDWLLDWPQFVRNSDWDWAEYVRKKGVKGDYAFRLYARKRRLKEDRGDFTELVFSKSYNRKDDILEEPTAVLVKKNSHLAQEITQYIDSKATFQDSSKKVLGSFDPLGQARVRVVVGYEDVNGDRVLVLKKLLAKDWLIDKEALKQDAKK